MITCAIHGPSPSTNVSLDVKNAMDFIGPIHMLRALTLMRLGPGFEIDVSYFWHFLGEHELLKGQKDPHRKKEVTYEDEWTVPQIRTCCRSCFNDFVATHYAHSPQLVKKPFSDKPFSDKPFMDDVASFDEAAIFAYLDRPHIPKSDEENEEILYRITRKHASEFELLYVEMGRRDDPFSYLVTLRNGKGGFIIDDPESCHDLTMALWELNVPRVDIPKSVPFWRHLWNWATGKANLLD